MEYVIRFAISLFDLAVFMYYFHSNKKMKPVSKVWIWAGFTIAAVIYTLFGSPTAQLHTSQLAQWRNQRIGFVLQESALINSLTIEDNIKLPFLYAGSEKMDLSETENFEAVVSAIGIKPILKKKPLECSGGERARTVFARGIIMNPQIILADEPTASLDRENRERIVTLLFRMNTEFNTTIITVTHDLEIANRHDRVIHLERRK